MLIPNKIKKDIADREIKGILRIVENTAKIKCAKYKLHYDWQQDEDVILPIGFAQEDLDRLLINPEPRIEGKTKQGEDIILYPYPKYGTIWLEDGAWLEYVKMGEGDRWEYFKTPEIPEMLQNRGA